MTMPDDNDRRRIGRLEQEMADVESKATNDLARSHDAHDDMRKEWQEALDRSINRIEEKVDRLTVILSASVLVVIVGGIVAALFG